MEGVEKRMASVRSFILLLRRGGGWEINGWEGCKGGEGC